MGRFYRQLTDEHVEFIRRQHVFFTATAPADGGRINCSPKGYDSLAVLDPSTLVFLDYVGSGNETANHVTDNGRITLMWCSFAGKPLILRVYGYGSLVEKDDADYGPTMARHFASVDLNWPRRLIRINVEAAQTSCGFGVPLLEYVGERSEMGEWTAKQIGKGVMDKYIRDNASRGETKFPLQSPR